MRTVAGLLGFLLGVTGCSGGLHEPTNSPSAAAARSSFVEVQADRVTTAEDGPVAVTIAAGSASGGVLQVVSGGDEAGMLEAASQLGVTPIGDPVAVTLTGGTLRGPAQLRFQVTEPPTEDSEAPLVVVWEDRDGGWRMLPAESDSAGGNRSVVATVDHFSIGFLGRIDFGRWVADRERDALDFFTGRSGVADPMCEGEDVAREGVVVASDEGDRVKWCFGIEDGYRVLKISNNTRTFAQVTYPSDWKVLDGFSAGLSVDAVARNLGAKVPLPPGHNARVIDGGDTLVLIVPAASSGRATVEMSTVAWLVSTIDFAAKNYFKVAHAMNSELGRTAESAWQRAGGILGLGDASALNVLQECAHTGLNLTEMQTPSLSYDTASDIADVATSCVATFMRAQLESADVFLVGNILTVVGSIYSTTSTAVHLVVTGTRELWDQAATLGGESDFIYDIAIGEYISDGDWLFEFYGGRRSGGQAGQRRTGTLNGVTSRESTSFWVGCDGEPAVVWFDLKGDFTSLVSTLYLDDFTPDELSIEVVISADGVPVLDVVMDNSDEVPVLLDMKGVTRVELSAEALNPDLCTSSGIGYGVLYEAAFDPA